jgi:hypothetical protein
MAKAETDPDRYLRGLKGLAVKELRALMTHQVKTMTKPQLVTLLFKQRFKVEVAIGRPRKKAAKKATGKGSVVVPVKVRFKPKPTIVIGADGTTEPAKPFDQQKQRRK